MQAIVFDGEAKYVDNYAEPQCEEGQACIAVESVGICRTDLEILQGYMGFKGVLGHEFVGRVVDGPERWLGKRVTSEINCPCGVCGFCLGGLGGHCPNREVIGIVGHDGAMAEKIVVPVNNLHKVPETISNTEAVFIEPLAAAFEVTRQVDANHANAVVLGDGRLGQLVARVLKPRASTLVVVGKHAEKLEAAEKQGIQSCLLEDFRPTGEADIVVDATGTADGFELAMKTVRPRGTIVLKSTFTADSGINLAPIVINEVTLIGSRCGPFGEAIRALASGAVDVSAMVSAQYSLRQGVEALQAAANSENLKVIVDVK